MPRVLKLPSEVKCPREHQNALVLSTCPREYQNALMSYRRPSCSINNSVSTMSHPELQYAHVPSKCSHKHQNSLVSYRMFSCSINALVSNKMTVSYRLLS
mgnify:CR=1 FL=1